MLRDLFTTMEAFLGGDDYHHAPICAFFRAVDLITELFSRCIWRLTGEHLTADGAFLGWESNEVRSAPAFIGAEASAREHAI